MLPRTVHLALLDTTADWEIGYLTAHLASLGDARDSGFRLRTASADGRPVRTMGGLHVTPDMALEAVDPQRSAMLVLPGAESWPDPQVAAPFVAAARAHLDAGVPVAAICGATFALAAAGLLDDRRHTSNDPAFLAASGYAGGAHYVADAPVVDDGDVITATGLAPLPFARAVFERLGAHPADRLDAWSRLYTDRDPAAYVELMSA